MGCRSSKLPPTAELPPALRPVGRKIEEMKKRRRKRSERYSIVSTTELLQHDDRDTSSCSRRKAERDKEEGADAPAQLADVKEEQQEEEEEIHYLTSDEGPEEVYHEAPSRKKEVQMAPATVEEEEECRKLRAVTARRGKGGEEPPGSPSFRIYFAGPIRDPNNKANGTEEPSKISEGRVAHARTDSKDHLHSIDDSASTQHQHHHHHHQHQHGKKAKKLGAITKANLAVHHMWNVRHCHSNQPSTEATTTKHAAATSPHLLMPLAKAS